MFTIFPLIHYLKYNLEGRELHALQHNEEGEIFDVWNNEERMMETHLHHGSYIGELGYVEYGRSSADKVIQYYPLFSPEGLSGAVDFAPEDIHDIVSVDMWIARDQPVPGLEVLAETVRLHCDDRKICERIGEMLAGAEKETGQSGCPFYTALYLTRSDGTIGTVFPALASLADSLVELVVTQVLLDVAHPVIADGKHLGNLDELLPEMP